MNEKPNAAPVDWSWIRSVLSQGSDIQMDYRAGKYASYEHYAARLDCAASERLEQIAPNLPDSETRDTEAIMALADKYASECMMDRDCARKDGDLARAALRAAVERVCAKLAETEYNRDIATKQTWTFQKRAERAEQEAAAQAKEIEALRKDAERLDWLENFVLVEHEIHLHDGHHPRGTGLGLAGRTLRAAVDAAKGE